jgi:hypothetical protein
MGSVGCAGEGKKLAGWGKPGLKLGFAPFGLEKIVSIFFETLYK